MRIENLKINGIRNPIGYDFSRVLLSYLIDEAPKGELVFCIYNLQDACEPIYTQTLDYKKNFCTPIHFCPDVETRYWFEIRCTDIRSDRCYFETGTKFDCPFIETAEEVTHPVFFRSFSCKQIVKARLYVTGLGLYEATLNGKRVGSEYLTPNCNDYDAYVQYQTYDISEIISAENKLEIALGNGWYKGRFGLKHRENIYGSNYICAAKIVLWHADGSKEVILTDESWQARTSHTLSGNIYDGEIIDDTIDCEKTYSVKFCKKKYAVTERISLPVVIKKQIKPKLYVSPKGEQILDFGQNFSGFVSFECDLQHGQTVRLQAGEILQQNCFYRENLRTAKAEFVYTSDGRKKIVYPRFTFYGFRYMLVDGIDKVNVEDFTGNVLYSDLEETVEIKTDNPKINRLLENCMWGQRSNFVDVPTDCPQRDERLGWTGDAEVFCSTACYQMNCKPFYGKYCKDMAIDQQLYGNITTYSPAMKEGEVASSVWSDAATIIPWTVYQFYGDKELLARDFPLMEQSVKSVIEQDDLHGGNRLYHFGFHLGDWLSQDGVSANALKGATSEYFIASCYYYNSVKIVAQAARVLDYNEKAEWFEKIQIEIRQAILDEYFTSSGRLSVDTQTAYVLCVMFDIYRDWKKLVTCFSRRIKKDCYVVKGGFVGATKLVQALVKSGLCDDAFRIVYSERFPSWLYCVNLGATTIWERWNSLNPDGTISGTGMNSLNHYTYGSVAEAFYAYFAGLRLKDIAFKKVVIEPHFNYRMKKLDFKYKSVSGEYRVAYEVTAEGKIDLHITVPYGAEAELILGGKKQTLTDGNYKFLHCPNDNLIHPFSIDSRIYDIVDNEQTAEILRQVVPGLYHFFKDNPSGMIGMEGSTFRALCALKSFFVPQSKIELLDNKLRDVIA